MRKIVGLIIFIFALVVAVCAVSETTVSANNGNGTLSNPTLRKQMVENLYKQNRTAKANALLKAKMLSWREEGDADGTHFELMYLMNGRPIYYVTQNANAAISTGVHLIRDIPPYNLDGNGLTVGVWDGGGVLPTHQEFGSRVTIMDGTGSYWHSTHVGGTIGASGIQPAAMGMAPEVDIDSYDWDYDNSEMADRAASYPGEPNKIYLSSHSYGEATGWTLGDYSGSYGYHWFGTWGDREDEGFGQYGTEAVNRDGLCYSAPYYLVFQSAGNDRGDYVPPEGDTFYYYDGGNWQSKSYDSSTDPYADNWDGGGFDTIPYRGNAKNIMTVGAVGDAVFAGERYLPYAVMASFSSWGPTDDGRIKPDIVANGASLYSTIDDSDTSYDSFSGTSMSAPNASGSAVLLIELYCRLFPGQAMLASTLKALIIHTADDLGNAGPDYSFGWGLMNAHAAAEQIMDHNEYPAAGKIIEGLLDVSDPNDSYIFTWNGETAIRATLCWTDPPATAVTGLDNPLPRLINDLDLRIIGPNSIDVYYPYVLDAINPANPAATGDNILDNVEQVYIEYPTVPGVYTVLVEHKGTLTDGEQHYSLIISGQHYASSAGTIEMDKDTYSCAESIEVELRDGDLAGSGTYDISIFTSGGDSETLTLYEDGFRGGIFTGTISISSGVIILGDGVVQATHGQTITAEYQDANDGSGSPATVNDVSTTDCEAPTILNVQILDITSSAATITFETNEPATTAITYGPDCEEPNGLLEDPSFLTGHSFQLSGLDAETGYYFTLIASDQAGNEAIDDNSGLCYQFATGAEPCGIHVPGDYNTIQAAIDAASNGDIIIVADGIYTGLGNRDVNFIGKAITVTSENGPVNCIIDCEGDANEPHRGFCFGSSEGSDSILSGFTIINGFGPKASILDPLDPSGPGYHNFPAAGAILCSHSSPTIEDCVFRDNEADGRFYHWGRGGAIVCTFSSAVIRNCTFENNCGYYGGGLYTEKESITITGCTFTGNTAREGGGLKSYKSALRIENSVFNGNSVNGAAGGICCDDGGPVIRNCIISDNIAYNPDPLGKGFYGGIDWSPMHDEIMEVINCTVVNNWSEAGSGGIQSSPLGFIYVTNSIVRGNTSNQVGGTDGRIVTYSNIENGFSGEGNIDADPCFVSATDFHLTSYSPCIDSGTNEVLSGFPPVDLEGKPRPLDGDANQTNIADMGAYEFWSGPAAPFIAVDRTKIPFVAQDPPIPEEKLFLLRNGWVGTLNWQITEDCPWLEVSPSSGVSTGDVNEVTVTVNPSGLPDGVYLYDLIISDANSSNLEETILVELHVGYLQVPSYYPTIGQAVAAAFDGDGITVANGIYTGEDNRNISIQDKRLTIISENGPASCIIDCQDANRGFYIFGPNTNGTIIQGFTITNGASYGTDFGGGIYCESSDTTIENCRIINCSNLADLIELPFGGGLYFYNHCNSVVKNCVISGNYTGFAGGGLSLNNYCNLQISNCLVTGNHADYDTGGILCIGDSSVYVSSSTFVNNTSVDGGAISAYSGCSATIVDSILWGNSPYPAVGNVELTFCDIEGVYAGIGNINTNPYFVTGQDGDYYLSQTAAGQAIDSPCVNAGSDTAANLGMDIFTTRTDEVVDGSIVDIGYHYPNAIPNPADINGDGNIDFLDFAILASQWLQAPGTPSADIAPPEGDGIVDVWDLGIFANNWPYYLVGPAEPEEPNDANAPISYWEFNEGSGSTAYDSIGYNDGVIAGAMWLDDPCHGICLNFDGVDDYVNVADNASLHISGAITLSSWLKLDANSVTQAVIGKVTSGGGYSGGGYHLVFSSGTGYSDGTFRLVFKKSDGDAGTGTGNYGTNTNWDRVVSEKNNWETGVWYHVAATWDGTTGSNSMKMYINGAPDANHTASQNVMKVNNNPLQIGRTLYTSPSSQFDGTIDNVRIYNRALSAEEVEQLYYGGL